MVFPVFLSETTRRRPRRNGQAPEGHDAGKTPRAASKAADFEPGRKRGQSYLMQGIRPLLSPSSSMRTRNGRPQNQSLPARKTGAHGQPRTKCAGGTPGELLDHHCSNGITRPEEWATRTFFAGLCCSTLFLESGSESLVSRPDHPFPVLNGFGFRTPSSKLAPQTNQGFTKCKTILENFSA